MQFFLSQKDRLTLGANGAYPNTLIEIDKEGSQKKHDVHEKVTRPWIRHYFYTQLLRELGSGDIIEARDRNLIDILKTTLPLAENSYAESSLSCWRIFIDTSFKTIETKWLSGQRKIFLKEKFSKAVEHIEIEPPFSNPQRSFLFLDENRFLRRLPKIPIKLFFSFSNNYLSELLEILKQSVLQNPHNRDVEHLMYLFYKGFNAIPELIEFAKNNNRSEYLEWIYWAEDDKRSLAEMRRSRNEFELAFYFYDSASLTPAEYKEIADWYLSESEFKFAYHFYYKAKEFEIAQDILQNIGIKEFSALAKMRHLINSSSELNENTIKNLFEQELETLQGFNRIRANESYQRIASSPSLQFDRETVENKYAFGELTEEEYLRLLAQLRDRRH
ncbi:MAG: hypothetical protein IGBAC_0787 [Ignavibacteriae bacterium]|nr:MAG: hypothetical protein IGBAC_0787 [Ignavibacteriota bacterium]